MEDCKDDGSLIATVIDVVDNNFWYLACESCKTKKQKIECLKCGGTKFSMRYRITFELDTKFSRTVRLTAFGKNLEKVFGVGAEEFEQRLNELSYPIKAFQSFIKDFFVGTTLRLDPVICSRLKSQSQKKTRRQGGTCSSVCTDSVCLATSSNNSTVYDKFDKLNRSSASSVELVCSKTYDDGFDTLLNISEILQDDSDLKDTVEYVPAEPPSSLTSSSRNTSVDEKNSSRRFMSDSFTISLMRNNNSTFNTFHNSTFHDGGGKLASASPDAWNGVTMDSARLRDVSGESSSASFALPMRRIRSILNEKDVNESTSMLPDSLLHMPTRTPRQTFMQITPTMASSRHRSRLNCSSTPLVATTKRSRDLTLDESMIFPSVKSMRGETSVNCSTSNTNDATIADTSIDLFL